MPKPGGPPLQHDEEYIAQKRAEIDQYKRLSAPAPEAPPEDHAAFERLPNVIRDAERALAQLESKLRGQRLHESRHRQQEVREALERLRLQHAVSDMLGALQVRKDKGDEVAGLLLRQLCQDDAVDAGIGPANAFVQRRFVAAQVVALQRALRSLPVEEKVAEIKLLQEFFRLLPVPSDEDPHEEKQLHAQLQQGLAQIHAVSARLEKALVEEAAWKLTQGKALEE